MRQSTGSALAAVGWRLHWHPACLCVCVSPPPGWGLLLVEELLVLLAVLLAVLVAILLAVPLLEVCPGYLWLPMSRWGGWATHSLSESDSN